MFWGYYRADNNEHKCERDSWGLSFVGEFSLTRKRCWIALHVVRRSHYVHHVFFVKRCSQWGEYCVLPALWRLKQMSSKKEGISPRKMQDNFACGSQWFLCIQMDCTLGIPYPDSISLYRSISITMCFLWDYQVFRLHYPLIHRMLGGKFEFYMSNGSWLGIVWTNSMVHFFCFCISIVQGFGVYHFFEQ